MLTWEAVKPFSKNFTQKNVNKVEGLGYEYLDLLHDCYIKFRECTDMYDKEDDALMMDIYKTSLENMVLDLIRHQKHQNDAIIYYEDFEENVIEDMLAAEEDVTLRTHIALAPEPIKTYLRIISESSGKNISNKLLLGNNNKRNTINAKEELRKYILS